MRNSDKTAVIIILDSVGIGEAPDAGQYGDIGADTLGNICKYRNDIRLPHLQSLGIGNIKPLQGIQPVERPAGGYGKMMEQAVGKDTIMGHWEITGVISRRHFETFPHGFPDDIIIPFEKKTEHKALGNKTASGTVIIEELGEEHFKTGDPIVYTSADSVFQIAAHEDIIPVKELYRYCRIAREILDEKHHVARVIARPFIGKPGAFMRTSRRKDFAVPSPSPTILDVLKEMGFKIAGIGKIEDIYSGQGLTHAVHTDDNPDGIRTTLDLMQKAEHDLIYVNLVDFDSLYGHRNNPEGYAQALEEFDLRLPEFTKHASENTLLIITADHGNDPTFKGTDHTREYVPLLITGGGIEPGRNLGTRETFADVGKTVLDFFQINNDFPGRSCLS